MKKNLKTEFIVSPWTGGITEAIIDNDTNMVIAAHGATCQPFFLATPESIFKGELRDVMIAIPAPDMEDISEPVDGEIQTGLAALLNPNPTGCNVCGEPLHHGCCNPNRTKHIPTSEERADEMMEVFAIGDAHVDELERAIRAEGFSVTIDPETNHIRLVRTSAISDQYKKIGGDETTYVETYIDPRLDDPLTVHNMFSDGEPIPEISRSQNPWWKNGGSE